MTDETLTRINLPNGVQYLIHRNEHGYLAICYDRHRCQIIVLGGAAFLTYQAAHARIKADRHERGY